MPRPALEFDPRDAIQTHGTVTASLDAALEYLRARGLRLLPAYAVGMLPFSIVVLFLIDAIGEQHRSVFLFWCLLLLPATLWRWVWLAVMQQAVQRDVQARPGQSLLKRLLWILVMRLYANVLLTWGSVVVAPSFYGFFAGSFAVPVLLERDGPAWREMARMLGWVHHSAARLSRALVSLTMFSLLLLVTTYIVQRSFVNFVLGTILGIDISGMMLTMQSVPWLLSWCYFVFLLVDFGWTVAAVFLYYDSQSRRTGSDLRARMQLLLEQGAGRPM